VRKRDSLPSSNQLEYGQLLDISVFKKCIPQHTHRQWRELIDMGTAMGGMRPEEQYTNVRWYNITE
jgi:hypothetical protein